MHFNFSLLTNSQVIFRFGKLSTGILSHAIGQSDIGQKRRARRLKPTYEAVVWNVHDRIRNDQPRTNNAIEGFHSGLSSHITNSHPSIWKLIDGLKVAHHKSRKKITEYDRGDDFDQKAIYQRITKRLKNLVTRYDSSMPISEKIKFVKNVAHLINTD